MTRDRDESRALADLARRGLEGLGGASSTDQGRGDSVADRGLQQLILAQRALVTRRVRRRPALFASGLILAASAALLVFFADRTETPSLSYSVLPAPAMEDGLAPEASTSTGSRPTPKQYAFSDGSSIITAPGASIDVVRVDERGADVRVTQGRAHVNVVHRPDTHWRFDAGPFVVEVIGTSFELSWDPLAAQLSLRLREGAVDVRGPTVEGALRVRSGQNLVVSLATRHVVLSAAKPAASGDEGVVAPAAAPPGGATVPALAPPAATAAATAGASAISDRPAEPGPARTTSTGALATGAAANWRALVARGQFERVIAEARARPLKDCILRCSLDELRALGDAARYSGHLTVAERAYETVRRRFHGTTEGTAAAFLLGRTYEAKGDKDEAGRWYRQYLSDAPAGEFAVEAASGKARVARGN